VPGGIFAPMLLQGALLGLICAKATAFFGVAAVVSPAVIAVSVMAAYFTGIVRAPLTGVVLITEMTGELSLLFPLLASSLAAYLISEYFGEKPIYETLMQRNLRMSGDSSLSAEPFILNLVVEPGSAMDGACIRDLRLRSGCLFIGIRTGGMEKIPGGATRLTGGDEITLLVDPQVGEGETEVRRAASAQKEPDLEGSFSGS
jgi:CIC family chloride channel protein